jgi:2-amino-4-hydroxy-6-hydroxymethyldihydropteridine diphosphokinase
VTVVTAYIGLGSNLGAKRENLKKALGILDACEGISVKKVSSFIETEPVGGPGGQDNYINGAAELETTLEPVGLLRVLRSVEASLDRDRSTEERWGPRTCDLDILLMGDIVMDTPDLTIPHARMASRRFVLQPLAQIAPDAIDPVTGLSAVGMLAALDDGEGP